MIKKEPASPTASYKSLILFSSFFSPPTAVTLNGMWIKPIPLGIAKSKAEKVTSGVLKTTSTEASLANEAKIPYQAIGMVTDYDCWRVSEELVSMEIVKEIMEKVQAAVKEEELAPDKIEEIFRLVTSTSRLAGNSTWSFYSS